jgi:hypothetical protein
MSEKLQRFQARARELACSGKFNGWHPIAFELQFEEGFTEAIQWTYSRSTQEELDTTCRESRNRLGADPSKWGTTGSSDHNHPSKSLGTFPRRIGFSPLTGRPLGGRSMAYALGGILLLVGVVLYATVETRFELRRDQQQLESTERGSGIDRLGTLSQ